MAFFITEQNEKVDLETKVKSLLMNLWWLILLAISLIEGVISLFTEKIEMAIPFLIVSFLFAFNYLYMRKFSVGFNQKYVLTISLITCILFIILGGNTGFGIIWSLSFPFIVMITKGRKEGSYWAFALLAVMLLHFFIIQGLIGYIKTYVKYEIISYCLSYSMAIILAYAMEFIRSEVLLAKERIILESQNKNKAQEEVIAKLSHQVRTPLSNITGILDLLEASNMTDEQQDYVNTIRTSSNNLVNVVNNLVMTSKTTTPDSQEITSFNLYNTVNNVLHLFPSEENKTKFSLSLAADIPAQLNGNSTKLKQILLNLINSIIKNNKSESNIITLEVIKQNSMPNKVDLLFKITSNLIYDTKQDAHLSENFFNHQELVKLNASKIISQFDLAITQKMIEVEDNSLTIVPQADKTVFEFGATFTTSMSKLASATVAPIVKKPVVNTPIVKEKIEMKNANILLVEDNFSNQQIISLYIRNDVKKIDIAFNGKEALEKFGLAKYDLILMDVQMPIMDGFKATQKIRELELSTNTHVPIIAVTANAFPEDKEKCLNVGMDDYISKPFQPEELISKIRENLSA